MYVRRWSACNKKKCYRDVSFRIAWCARSAGIASVSRPVFPCRIRKCRFKGRKTALSSPQKPTFKPTKADFQAHKSRLSSPQKPTFKPTKADFQAHKSRLSKTTISRVSRPPLLLCVCKTVLAGGDLYSPLRPVSSIQIPIPDGFGYVHGLYLLAASEVGYGAGYFEDAAIGTCRQLQSFHCHTQHIHGCCIRLRKLMEHTFRHLRIAVNALEILETNLLDLPCFYHPLTYLLTWLSWLHFA